jgi:hypothetical protein
MRTGLVGWREKSENSATCSSVSWKRAVRLLSKRVGEQPKAPDLRFQLADDVGLPPLAGEQSAHVADENAQRADKMSPRLRRTARASELSERFFHPHFNRHNEEAL